MNGGVMTFDDVFTMDNIIKSYYQARSGKSMREKVVFYHMDLMSNLKNLKDRLANGTYKTGQLTRFKVYEPKEREVIANMFEDKIIQDVLAKKVLQPLIASKLIYDNYASQPKKGTHKALQRLQRYTRIFAKSMNWKADGWVLVCDLSKFFYNIDQDLCWKLVDNLPIDDLLKYYLHMQITTCTPDINPYTDLSGRGLCIGFQTSQWLAVYYLDKLDHFIKEKLGIKCYGRYMDDFYLIHEDKEYLEYCKREIDKFCRELLHMELNKKTHIHPFRQGICFLGYRVTYDESTHDTVTVIRRKSVNKMLKRVKRHVNLIKLGLMTRETAMMSLDSWYAYAKHGADDKADNAYAKACKMINGDHDIMEEHKKQKDNWRNIDPNEYFILHTNKDTVLRDIDGYAVLLKKKTTKRENWRNEMYARVTANPEYYIESNMDFMLKMKPESLENVYKLAKSKKKTRRQKGREKIREALTKMPEM